MINWILPTIYFLIPLVGMVLIIRSGRVMRYEKYVHHSGTTPVFVRTDLKGKHRNYCLCFSCNRFHPGRVGNCPIAQALYKNCLKHNVVTPVWECPRFKQDPFANN